MWCFELVIINNYVIVILICILFGNWYDGLSCNISILKVGIWEMYISWGMCGTVQYNEIKRFKYMQMPCLNLKNS